MFEKTIAWGRHLKTATVKQGEKERKKPDTENVVLKITVLMISITRNRTCPNAYELTQVNLTGHR